MARGFCAKSKSVENKMRLENGGNHLSDGAVGEDVVVRGRRDVQQQQQQQRNDDSSPLLHGFGLKTMSCIQCGRLSMVHIMRTAAAPPPPPPRSRWLTIS